MILLDTHTLIWWLQEPNKLSKKARETIASFNTKKQLSISSITCWEIALLAKKGTITLKPDPVTWFVDLKKLSSLSVIAIDENVAFQSVLLPTIHTDPADRFIVATAQTHHLPIISKDAKLRKYPHIMIIW